MYNYYSLTNKNIVLDFKKFKANPVFCVTARGKEYKVDLSSHDFSNFSDHQRFLYLEEAGIRYLRDH